MLDKQYSRFFFALVFEPLNSARARTLRWPADLSWCGRIKSLQELRTKRAPLARSESIIADYLAACVERVTGIEPASSAWEAEALPLDDTRSVGLDRAKSSGIVVVGQNRPRPVARGKVATRKFVEYCHLTAARDIDAH